MIGQYPLDYGESVKSLGQEPVHRTEENRPGVVARIRAAAERVLAAIDLKDAPEQSTPSQGTSGTGDTCTSAYGLLCGSGDDDYDPWRWVFGRYTHGYPGTLGF